MLTKGRIDIANAVVFGNKWEAKKKESHDDAGSSETRKEALQTLVTAPVKSGGIFKEIAGLYSTSKQRRISIVCHITYFTSAFSYYVTG